MPRTGYNVTFLANTFNVVEVVTAWTVFVNTDLACSISILNKMKYAMNCVTLMQLMVLLNELSAKQVYVSINVHVYMYM